MKQTLFFLPTQIAGYPIFGTGILFWAILIIGAITIVRYLLQKRAGDAVFTAAIVALGLFLVRVVGPVISETNGFPIRGYGVFLTLAILLSTGLTIYRGRKLWNYPADALLGIVFVAAFFGIIGARVFYVVQYWQEFQAPTLRETIIDAVNITNGGLVVYGSMIGGVIAGILYVIYKKLPVAASLDLFAPSLMLGVAIGRLGCLMNGCCFGAPCDLPWAVVFPPESPAYMQQLDEGVISLYGITLQESPENVAARELEDKRELVGIKAKHRNLATETPSSVVVAAVDPGCEAERAGIKPGMRILEIGVAAEGAFTDARPILTTSPPSTVRRFRPISNAQFFYFFLNMWDEKSKDDVWLVASAPEDENADVDDANDHEHEHNHEKSAIRTFVYHPVHTEARPVHPTQIYSSLSALVICVVLLIVSKFVRRDGIVFSFALLLYPINRFALELFRTDEESFCGTGLTISQCVSLCVFALGIASFCYFLSRPPRRALEGFFTKETLGDSAATSES